MNTSINGRSLVRCIIAMFLSFGFFSIKTADSADYIEYGARNGIRDLPLLSIDRDGMSFKFIVALEVATEWVIFCDTPAGEKFSRNAESGKRLKLTDKLWCREREFQMDDVITQNCPEGLKEVCKSQSIAGVVSPAGIPFSVLEFDNPSRLFRVYDVLAEARIEKENAFTLVRSPDSTFGMLVSINKTDWVFAIRSAMTGTLGLTVNFMRTVHGTNARGEDEHPWGKAFNDREAKPEADNCVYLIRGFQDRRVLIDKKEMRMYVALPLP